jgi:hypothetical protein
MGPTSTNAMGSPRNDHGTEHCYYTKTKGLRLHNAMGSPSTSRMTNKKNLEKHGGITKIKVYHAMIANTPSGVH